MAPTKKLTFSVEGASQLSIRAGNIKEIQSLKDLFSTLHLEQPEIKQLNGTIEVSYKKSSVESLSIHCQDTNIESCFRKIIGYNNLKDPQGWQRPPALSIEGLARNQTIGILAIALGLLTVIYRIIGIWNSTGSIQHRRANRQENAEPSLLTITPLGDVEAKAAVEPSSSSSIIEPTKPAEAGLSAAHSKTKKARSLFKIRNNL